MHFTIHRDVLFKPLQLITGVVEKRQTLPILSNILLRVEGNNLSMAGTDLEVELIAKIVLDELMSPGVTTVPARKLIDICRSLPDSARIEVKLDDHQLLIRSGKSRFKLATLPADEFPLVEDPNFTHELNVPASDFHQLFNQTQFAMAHQDVRYFLNGTLFEIKENELNVVATDGHRLALASYGLAAGQPSLKEASIIIPRKAVLELLRLLDGLDETISFSISANHVRVKTAQFTFTSKLIEGNFPDYQRVIPKGSNKELLIDRDVLKQALSRVAILSNEKYRGVRLELEKDLLKLIANNPENERAEDEIEVSYDTEGLAIAFNVAYLLDVLNTVATGNIHLAFKDAQSSLLIQHAKPEIPTLFVVMPIRL